MVIAVDFDGTLCENAFPEIGEAKGPVINYIREMKRRGHKIILWTCRAEQPLQDAVEWCKLHGITFDAINNNLRECVNEYKYNCRKVNADLYIDDKAVNVNDLISILSKS